MADKCEEHSWRGHNGAMMSRPLPVLVIVAVMSVAAEAQAPPDLTALIGRTRAEIGTVFPGRSQKLEGWNGWKTVFLSINAKNRLLSVNLEPQTPMSEQQAEDAVRKLGVTLDRTKYVAASAVHAYRDMKGLIRTVNFTGKAGR
jgi:hypothetical protein